MSKAIWKSFELSDLDRTYADEDRLIMAETILAWADLDTGISRLLLLEFGVDDDAGSILIGNMDLKTKVEKIKLLHDHRGSDQTTKALASIITAMRKHSACRNTVAHRRWVGRLFSDPERLVFVSVRHVKRTPGVFEMEGVHRSELIASAKFAREMARRVHRLVIELEDDRHNPSDS